MKVFKPMFQTPCKGRCWQTSFCGEACKCFDNCKCFMNCNHEDDDTCICCNCEHEASCIALTEQFHREHSKCDKQNYYCHIANRLACCKLKKCNNCDINCPEWILDMRNGICDGCSYRKRAASMP